MINVIFEGPTGAGKTTTIRQLQKKYQKKKLKVGITNDIDKSSPLYKVIKGMFEENVLVSLKEKFNTLRYETMVQCADYLYLREKLYAEQNDINFFDRNYFSIYCYQSVILEKEVADYQSFMDSALNCMKSGDKGIDLLVFYGNNINHCIRRSEKRDHRSYTKYEKRVLREFNEKLTDYVRIHNNEYKLLVIDEKDSIEVAIKKISNKIEELLEDEKKSEEDKWYELYKIDIEEFKKPDDYITYKLKYKKKLINTIMKYSNKGKILEAGCGTGLLAGYMQKEGFEVTAIDLSQKILNYAKEIAEMSKVIKPCNYQQMDILNLKYPCNHFDLAYSNGVLEHFSDNEVVEILKQQMKVANYAVFGIPSTYFNMNEKMLGNERGLTLKEWEKLIDQAGGTIVEQTSFHYYKFHQRLLEVKKWFKPKAFWLFVVKDREK